MTCCVGCRHGLDLALLWLWCRLAAVTLIRSLALEPPYAMGTALKSKKKRKKKKGCDTYTQWNSTQPLKRKNNVICNNIDATRDSHTKGSKSERASKVPYVITYMWNLNYSTDEPIYRTETVSQTWRTVLWLLRGRE